MINAIGKVPDVKLLLMAGLMVSGRLKTIEKELLTKSEAKVIVFDILRVEKNLLLNLKHLQP